MILPQSSVPPSVVPIEWRAMPLGKLLPLVGAKLGRKLEATKAVADLPVFVRIEPGEKPDAVLDAIARCVYGEWTTGSDGVTRLKRNVAAWNEAVREEKAAVRKGWTLALARKKKKAATLGTPDWDDLRKRSLRMIDAYDPKAADEGFAESRALEDRSPAGRLAARLVEGLDPADLMDIPPLGLVYSDRPTRAQRPLSPAIVAAVRTWQGEQTAWFDVAERAKLADRADTKGFYSGLRTFRSDDAPATLGGIVLRVGRPSWGDEGADLRLRIYDGSGKIAARIDDQVIVRLGLIAGFEPSDPDGMKAYQDAIGKVFTRNVLSPLHSLSPVATTQMNLFQVGPEPPDPRLVSTVLDTTAFDPLAGRATEHAAAFAAWKKRSLIEWFDDAEFVLGGLTYRAGQGRPVRYYFDEVPPEGVIVGRPLRPVRAEKVRADRALLADLLRIAGKPERSLDDTVDVAYAIAGTSEFSLLRQWPDALRRRTLMKSGMNPNVEWGLSEWHEIYGGLTRAQRAGGTFRLSTLPEKLRTICLRRIYALDAPNLASFAEKAGVEGFREERIDNEPTVRWPQGPPDGTLTVTREAEEVAITRTRTTVENGVMSTRGGSAMSAKQYGFSYRRYVKASPPFAWPSEFRPGVRTVARLKLVFPGNVGFEGRLESVRFTGQEYVPFEKLPKSFRDATKG